MVFVLGAGAYVVAATVNTPEGIARGFVGVAEFGPWRLICVPGPPSLDGLLQASAAPAGSANACRVNQEVPLSAANAGPAADSSQLVLAANLSLVGPRKIPALMVRLPATAQSGDMIGLKLDNRYEVKTAVRDCAEGQCIAAGNLSAGDWKELLKAKTAQVRFPTEGGHMVLVDLKLEGLTSAIAAMGRADGS